MKLTRAQNFAQELMNTLISKCWESDEFKRSLIDNPKNTIERITGNPVNLPGGRSDNCL